MSKTKIRYAELHEMANYRPNRTLYTVEELATPPRTLDQIMAGWPALPPQWQVVHGPTTRTDADFYKKVQGEGRHLRIVSIAP